MDVVILVLVIDKEIPDQGKNPKLRVSSYFHSSFSPISILDQCDAGTKRI